MESFSVTKDTSDNQKVHFPYKPITKTTSSFFNAKTSNISQGINTSNTLLSPILSRDSNIKHKLNSNLPIAKQHPHTNAFIPQTYLKIKSSIPFLKKKSSKQSNLIHVQSNLPSIKYIKVSSSLPRLGSKIEEDFKKEEYYYKVEHLLRRGNNATKVNKLKKHLNNNTKYDYNQFVKDHLTTSSLASKTITSFVEDENEHNNNKYYRMFHKHSSQNNTSNNTSSITQAQPIQNKPTFTKNKHPTVKNNFKHQEQFAHFLISKYIQHKQPQPFSPQHRSIFIILDGSIVINEVIPGFFVDIPIRSKLKSISLQERQELLASFLNKCTELFKYPKLLCYIYTSTKRLIYDLIKIQNDDLYLYVSANLTINGIKIIPHPSLVSIYKSEFTSIKQFNGINTNDNTLMEKDNVEQHCRRRYMFKTRKKTDKEKLSKLLNNTFTLGEINYDSNDDVYIYYSDHDSKVLNKMKRNIGEHCYLKHDFFIYLNNLDTNNKIASLYKKLKRPYHNHKAVEDDYYDFKYPYDKMISRFINETTLNPKLIKKQRSASMQNDFKSKLTTNELTQNISVYNMQNPHNKYTKVYMNRNNKNNKDLKTNAQTNCKTNTFYHQLKKNVHLHYPHFLHFNIKHFLNLYKNFNRGNLFHIFIIYKDLISLCYGMNKSKLILKYGIDFNTFWKCVEDISVEKEEFVWKLFGQINKNKSGLLSMEDFFEGMSFIRNTDVREKLDLFLNALDQDGKGILSYDEVKRICKDSIKRCLNDNESTTQQMNQTENENDNEALEELSSFFAKYIFAILKVDINEKLNLVDVKNAIIDGSVETQYLEMFCGANKIN